MLSRAESFGFLDALVTRLTVPASDSVQAMESQDWRSQTRSTVVAEVNRARKSFYTHAQNLRLGFGIMIRMQVFLEKQGYKGLQWSADPHKGGLCEAMVDVLRGKLGGDIKLLGMFTKLTHYLLATFHTDISHCTRKLKPKELHDILEELLAFFDILPPILSDEQESRTTVVLLQSLLTSDSGGDDDSGVKEYYSDVAHRLSEWTKTFLT